MSLAHSHPPSHIIRNTKEKQLLLRRLLRICVYIYICKYFPTFSYILSNIFICFRIGSYIWFLYLLLYAPVCFAILSYTVLYMFPYVLILLRYILKDFPICSNRFQYFSNNSLRSLFFSPIGGAAIAWAQECQGTCWGMPSNWEDGGGSWC